MLKVAQAEELLTVLKCFDESGMEDQDRCQTTELCKAVKI